MKMTSKSEPGTFPWYHETNKKGLNRKTMPDLTVFIFNIKPDFACWQK